MAEPQVENGFTRIANELMEHLYKVDLSGAELRVILYIIRQTYGYCTKTRTIKQAEISQNTNLDKGTVSRALRCLISKNMVHMSGVVGINKDWETWENLDENESCQNATKLSKCNKKLSNDNKKLSKCNSLPLYKENYKEIYSMTNKICPSEETVSFEKTETPNPQSSAAPPSPINQYRGECIALLEAKRGVKKSVTGQDLGGIKKLFQMGVTLEEVGDCYDWIEKKWQSDAKMAGTPISPQTIAKYYPGWLKSKTSEGRPNYW